MSRQVARIRPGPTKAKSQAWSSFLENHARAIVAVDMFVVPTIRFQILYVFIILALNRRRLVFANVTTNPTAEWLAQSPPGLGQGRAGSSQGRTARARQGCCAPPPRRPTSPLLSARGLSLSRVSRPPGPGGAVSESRGAPAPSAPPLPRSGPSPRSPGLSRAWFSRGWRLGELQACTPLSAPSS